MQPAVVKIQLHIVYHLILVIVVFHLFHQEYVLLTGLESPLKVT